MSNQLQKKIVLGFIALVALGAFGIFAGGFRAYLKKARELPPPAATAPAASR